MKLSVRQEGDRERLDALIARERDARQRDRLRAARLALEGKEAPAIAAALGRSRRFVQEWAYAYRDAGIEAINPGKSSGRRPKLPRDKEQAFRARMLAGATEADGGGLLVTRRRRRADPGGGVRRELHARRRLRPAAPAAALVPGPAAAAPQERPAGDAAVARRRRPFVRGVKEAHRGSRLEVWRQDEARIGQQGTLTGVWGETNSRPTAVRQTRLPGCLSFYDCLNW